MDAVAQDLSIVQKKLDEDHIKYTITRTHPTRDLSKLDEDSLCVIRQQVDKDGVYHLTAAAKMRKGKC